jgi:hypothetical protein
LRYPSRYPLEPKHRPICGEDVKHIIGVYAYYGLFVYCRAHSRVDESQKMVVIDYDGQISTINDAVPQGTQSSVRDVSVSPHMKTRPERPAPDRLGVTGRRTIDRSCCIIKTQLRQEIYTFADNGRSAEIIGSHEVACRRFADALCDLPDSSVSGQHRVFRGMTAYGIRFLGQSGPTGGIRQCPDL